MYIVQYTISTDISLATISNVTRITFPVLVALKSRASRTCFVRYFGIKEQLLVPQLQLVNNDKAKYIYMELYKQQLNFKQYGYDEVYKFASQEIR